MTRFPHAALCALPASAQDEPNRDIVRVAGAARPRPPGRLTGSAFRRAPYASESAGMSR